MVISRITLFILIVTLIFQLRKYGIKVLLHPSLYFIVTWLISIISFELFLAAGLKRLIIDVKILNELFLFVSFTSICFLLIGFKSSRPVRENSIKLKLSIPPTLFGFITILFFLTSFFGLFFISGFDVASNRQSEVLATREFYSNYGRYSILQLVFNVLNMLIIPFTLYGGWKFGKYYFSDQKQIKILYLLPLITGIFNVIAGGGRAGIISSTVFFVLGLLFALFSFEEDYLKKLKSLSAYLVLFIGLFLIYVTYVSKERSKAESSHNIYYASLDKYPRIKPLYGIMEYSVFHFQGYQWRRLDTATPELEMGRRTFSFILDFNVPIFSQILGKDLSLKTLFGMKDLDTVRGTVAAIKKKKPGPSITATVFFPLYDDFGFYGVFCLTFLFVAFTERLYRNLFVRFNINFLSIILFIAVYKLWSSTIFSHHLTGAWFNEFLYPILLIELMNLFAKFRPSKLTIDESSRIESPVVY